jgi:hypothetical protein
MKLDLLTNATVVDDTIRFVSSKPNEKVKSFSHDDKEESTDYSEDQDQLEAEQETPLPQIKFLINIVDKPKP